ncbi:MAG: hypothetical protein JNJ94_13295 [Chlorobi bacterium]|nr:hypothetical protein [Chlorobiota bacterium]
MPRTTNYYFDYKTGDGHRHRLWVRPAYGGERTVEGWPGYSAVSTPAWGAGSSTSWKQCPDGWLKSTNVGEAGYDGLPIGLPDTPTRSFRVDLQLLNVDADLQDLARYLVTPVVAGQSLKLNSSEVAWSSATVDTLNVFTLLTDAGDPSLTISQFAAEYIGVQYRRLENEIDVSQETGETLMDVDTLHVLRALMTEITPSHLQTNMLNEVQDNLSGYTEKTTTSVVDMVWTADDVRHERILGNPSDTPHQVFHWFKISDLWRSLGFLFSGLLEIYTGLPDVTVSFATPSGFPANVGAMTMWELRQQSGAITGAAQTTGFLSAADLWFLGDVQYSDNEGSSTSHIGGFLHPNEKAGVGRYDTLWDFMKELCEQCCCRVVIEQSYFGAITLRFLPLNSSMANTVIRADLTPDADRLKIVLWKEVISGATSEITGATDGDYEKGAEYRVWGIRTEARRTVPTVFQNWPSVGNIDDRASRVNVSFISATTTDVAANILVYFSDVNDIYGTEQAVRVHHYVGIRKSDGSVQYDTINGPSEDLPTPILDYEDSEAEWESQFWYPWRDRALEVQQRGGVSYAATAFIAKMFSKWSQYQIECKVPYHKALLHTLGTRITLDAATLVPDGDYLDDLPDNPIVTKITPEGLSAAITVLGVE